MTDAHCHVPCGDSAVREFLIGRDFVGVHPWDADGPHCSSDSLRELGFASADTGDRPLSEIMARLDANPKLGVGEIGLDRLKTREISATQRQIFEAQLERGLGDRRPIVLHGAKCWGQIVKTIEKVKVRGEGEQRKDSTVNLQPSASTFLFHGFSRSDGLIPEIVALGGFISVGPAVLNDHAVNYRELVKKIPSDRLLVETDRTEANAATCPAIADVIRKVADLRNMTFEALVSLTDTNASHFMKI